MCPAWTVKGIQSQWLLAVYGYQERDGKARRTVAVWQGSMEELELRFPGEGEWQWI